MSSRDDAADRCRGKGGIAEASEKGLIFGELGRRERRGELSHV